MEKNKVGSLALIVGLIIAVLAAFGVTADWLPWVVAVLGLIIGLLNISGAESQRFLLAAIGLMLTATAVIELPYVGDIVTAIVTNIVVLLAPAVLVVALRSLFETARN